MSMIINIVMVFALIAIVIVIPTFIGIYVYRDAKRRNMNVAMWTLIALIAPSMVGFIIYLIVRGKYADLTCPNCQTAVKEDYVRCPKCGAKLQPSCPNCSAPVEYGWTVCPRCAALLPEMQNDTVIPVKHKDKSLEKILLAVILIPLVFTVAMISSLTFSRLEPNIGGTAVTSMLAEEYLQKVDNDNIAQWFDQIKEDGKIHVLRNEVLVATGEPEKTRYLIYMPQLEDPNSIDFDNGSGLFNNKLHLKYTSYSGDDEDRFILITCTGSDADLKLEIYCDGSKVGYELMEVDYPLGLTDNMDSILTEQEFDPNPAKPRT